MWRHLAVGGLDHAKARLQNGMTVLKKYRDGTGRWRRFPFYYTLLALTEIDTPSARQEMQYAARVCERVLKRLHGNGRYGRRRKIVLERVLAYC